MIVSSLNGAFLTIHQIPTALAKSPGARTGYTGRSFSGSAFCTCIDFIGQPGMRDGGTERSRSDDDNERKKKHVTVPRKGRDG